MKEFTKKQGFFVMSAALLIVIAMLGITWCSNGISNGDNTDNFTPPSGKGAVRLNFDEKIARTILPDHITGISSFDEFEFQFTSTGGGGTSKNVDHLAYSELINPIILDPGDYTLKVIGYVDEGTPGSPVLHAMATNATPIPVKIEAGKIAKEKVVLRPIFEDDGIAEGSFVYTLSNTKITPADITTASMSIVPIGTNGTTTEQNIDIKALFTGLPQPPITLYTGIYYVEFTIRAGGDTVSFKYVLHIYKDEISSYTFILGLDYFNAVYQGNSGDVTFEGNANPEILYVITPKVGPAGSSTAYTTPDLINTIHRGDTIEFTVDNADIYDGGIEWYCLSNTALVNSTYCTIGTDTCTINTSSATSGAYNSFSSARDYILTVVGVIGDHKYATLVYFSVTP